MIVLLDNPTTCPHGNPMPGLEPGARSEQRCLAKAEPGENIRLLRITESVERECRLADLPGGPRADPRHRGHIQAKAPDGTLTLVVGDATVAVGPAMTQRFFVASA